MYDYAPNLLTLSCEQSLACTYIVPNISGRVIACPIAELLLLRINIKDCIYTRVTFRSVSQIFLTTSILDASDIIYRLYRSSQNITKLQTFLRNFLSFLSFFTCHYFSLILLLRLYFYILEIFRT